MHSGGFHSGGGGLSRERGVSGGFSIGGVSPAVGFASAWLYRQNAFLWLPYYRIPFRAFAFRLLSFLLGI